MSEPTSKQCDELPAAHWKVTYSVRLALGIEITGPEQVVEVDVVGPVAVVADGVLRDGGEFMSIRYGDRTIVVPTSTLTML